MLAQCNIELWVLCFAVCRSLSTIWINRSSERLTGRLLLSAPLLLGMLYTSRHPRAVRQNGYFITSRQSGSKQEGKEANITLLITNLCQRFTVCAFVGKHQCLPLVRGRVPSTILRGQYESCSAAGLPSAKACFKLSSSVQARRCSKRVS